MHFMYITPLGTPLTVSGIGQSHSITGLSEHQGPRSTVQGKTLEGENFPGWMQNSQFAGKHSW